MNRHLAAALLVVTVAVAPVAALAQTQGTSTYDETLPKKAGTHHAHSTHHAHKGHHRKSKGHHKSHAHHGHRHHAAKSRKAKAHAGAK